MDKTSINPEMVSKHLKTYLKEFQSLKSQIDINATDSRIGSCLNDIENYFDQIDCVQKSTVFVDDDLKEKVLFKINNLLNSKMELLKVIL
jgi:hypothetical protein